MRHRSTLLATFLLLGNALPASAVEPGASSVEAQGHADRLAFESWIGGLGGDPRRGVDFWVQERGKPQPLPCTVSPPSPEYAAACQETRRRLAVPDVRQRTEPDYRRGWNAPVLDVNATAEPITSKNNQRAASQKPSPATELRCRDVLVTGVVAAHPFALAQVDATSNLNDLLRRNPPICTGGLGFVRMGLVLRRELVAVGLPKLKISVRI